MATLTSITAFSAGNTGNISNTAMLAANSTPLFSAPTSARTDSYNTTTIPPKVLPKEGSTDPEILAKAPSCTITVNGEKKKAVIVVDLASYRLYKYDKNGQPEIAYSIAKGKASTPTHTGVRKVVYVDVAPYKYSYNTKRKRNPKPYGKRVIVLDKVDPKTGSTSTIGEFIHGNGDNDTSMGQAVSGGCMRMANDAVIALAKQVKHGDYVLIK